MTHASDDTLLFKPKFGGLVLVCGECQKRGNGPSKLKAKDVRKTFRKELGNLAVRTRIVQCSCLGLCPKKAMAVAAVASGGSLQAAEVRGEEEAVAAATRLARIFR